MALDFFTGFDHYSTSELALGRFSTASGSVQTGTVKNGTRAWQGTGAENLQKTNLSNVVTRILGGWYRFDTNGAGRAFMVLSDGSPNTPGDCQVSLLRTGTNLVRVERGVNIHGFGGTLLGTSANNLPINTWSFVELVVTVNNSTGTVEVFVDGTKSGWIDLTGQDTQQSATAQANAFAVGTAHDGGAAYWDDVYCVSGTGGVRTARLGRGRALSYLPDANGAVRNWTPSTGANDFAVVDEVPPNSDTDYLSSAVLTNIVTMGYPAVGTTDVVKGLQVLSFQKTTGTGTARGIARVSGTNYAGTNVVATSAYAFASSIYEQNPNAVADWTATTIDAAEFGQEQTA